MFWATEAETREFKMFLTHCSPPLASAVFLPTVLVIVIISSHGGKVRMLGIQVTYLNEYN